MPYTTKQAIELGVKQSLLNQHEEFMNHLWPICKALYDAESTDMEILVYDYRIGIWFMNDDYLELKVRKGDDDYLTLRCENKHQVARTLMSFFPKPEL